MEKLLLSNEYIIKAIKTYHYENKDKNTLNIIKKINSSSLIIEEVKTKLQNVFIEGTMITRGRRENKSNNDFEVELDQNFHTPIFPLFIQGNELAAYSYAILNKNIDKVGKNYPYKKEKINELALELGTPYFEKYYEKINLKLNDATIKEAKIKESEVAFEHTIWLLKVKNNSNVIELGYIERESLDNNNKQHICFFD